MITNYFSIERDKEVERDGGFWCNACLVSRPVIEQSPDPRICLFCYDLLLKEAEMLTPKQGSPEWIPRVTTEPQIGIKNPLPIETPIGKQKTKMSTLNPPTLSMDNFRPRGRPKTYKKLSLPEDKIKQLHEQGIGARAIASQLKREQGIDVSYKTIQRVLSGERN